MLKPLLLCSLLFSPLLHAADNPRLAFSTSLGEIEVELYAEQAPISVGNFLDYAEKGFYNGLQFHRVIPGFMIQTGQYDAELEEREAQAPIRNEADSGLRNLRGTLAMARSQVVDSATSQFFINLRDNPMLDHGVRGFGYAVFGQVTQGMDVVERIARSPTGYRRGHRDVPMEPVLIQSVRRLD